MNHSLLLRRALYSSIVLTLAACGDSNNSSDTSTTSSASSSAPASSSAAPASSSEASSSSAGMTSNLVSDPGFESGVLNGDDWQTDPAAMAAISMDAAFVSGGTSGVNIDTDPNPAQKDDTNYVETNFSADEIEAGEFYFVSLDTKAKATADWKDWKIGLYKDGEDNPVAFRTINHLGIGPVNDTGEWYERAAAFTAPNTEPDGIIGVETSLRITGVFAGAIDNIRMKKIDTYIANYDFEDADVGAFRVSGASTLTTNTAQALDGTTSLSVTGDVAGWTLELPLAAGDIQSGERYLITMNYGSATKDSNNPFRVQLVDTASNTTAGAATYNYVYFAQAERLINGAFVIDIDRDQSSDIDWSASSSVVLRFVDQQWAGSFNTEFLIDNFTISKIPQ